MKKKELEKIVYNQHKKINELDEKIERWYEFLEIKMLTMEEAYKRDYIVRTKYIGKLKDKKLIEDFKKEFEDYNNVCNSILNYEFEQLHNYYEKLKLYEKKQIVIDVYGTKA